MVYSDTSFPVLGWSACDSLLESSLFREVFTVTYEMSRDRNKYSLANLVVSPNFAEIVAASSNSNRVMKPVWLYLFAIAVR